jgi:ubiquinone/menaquinone biosynthesis C-methylase UbiE
MRKSRTRGVGQSDADPELGARETYAFTGSTYFSQYMAATRSATKQAAFVLPHVRPGLTVLDCGCGPGSITVGLAEIVAPGRVTGIDTDAAQIERARAEVAARGASAIEFQTASVYALPFPEASFDVVFSHALLEHLAEPLLALKEMQRVVKPGGVIGVRTRDWEGLLLAPTNPLLQQSITLWERLSQHNGGNPRVGKHLRGLLHHAGFARAEVSASYDYHATPETTDQWSTFWSAEVRGKMGGLWVTLGWTDQAEVEAMAAAWTTWAQQPDAFLARAFCEAVAWR